MLAVAHPLSFHRLISLPPLSRPELSQVFRRRASGLSGDKGGAVYYAARAMEREAAAAGQGVGQQSWLVAGVVSASVRDLRLALREQGFRVRRVVSAELAALEWARQHAPDPERASIVIVVGETSLSVALVNGSVLVHQDSIAGDFASQPALATSLVQEVKACAGFWRKKSRGGIVGQVVVVGLPRSRVELLGLTLAALLPGAVVRSVSEESTDPSGRIGFLQAPLASGPLSPDLTFWLPRRRITVGLLSALGATVSLAGAFLAFDSASRRVAEVNGRVQELHDAAPDLEDLRARNQQIEEHMVRIEEHALRAAEVESWGLPLERMLGAVARSFAGRAELEELEARALEAGGTVTIQGRCPRDPATLVPRLRELMDELRRESLLQGLTLALPERFDGERVLETSFTIAGRLEG